ncbi:MAG TPA: hypothetical protein DEA08_14580 [Planctomycetes bacterium]|nr:hypothetical protein [Planctomycetota bacterium]
MNDPRKTLAAQLLLASALAGLSACASQPAPEPAPSDEGRRAPAPRAAPSPAAKEPAPAPPAKKREPEPVAVLIQTDPSLTVAGSDTPRAAVYANGLVIGVRVEKGREPIYVSGQLSQASLAQLKRDLAELGDPASWKPRYDVAPGVPGQPETKLYLRLGERTHATRIYGFPSQGRSRPSKRADAVPPGALEVYRYLCSLGLEDAQPYVPKLLEVMVWSEPGVDYSQAPAWPLGWAAFDSPRTIRRSETSYSIFLAGSRLEDLRAFLERGQGQARIEDRGWWVDFRFAFPSYRVYEEAFAR